MDEEELEVAVLLQKLIVEGIGNSDQWPASITARLEHLDFNALTDVVTRILGGDLTALPLATISRCVVMQIAFETQRRLADMRR